MHARSLSGNLLNPSYNAEHVYQQDTKVTEVTHMPILVPSTITNEKLERWFMLEIPEMKSGKRKSGISISELMFKFLTYKILLEK